MAQERDGNSRALSCMAGLQERVMGGKEGKYRGDTWAELMCGYVEDRDRVARQCEGNVSKGCALRGANRGSERV